MVAILNTNEEVVVKIKVQVGESGNLHELAEKVAPCHGEFNRAIPIVPNKWPEVCCRGAGKMDQGPLMLFTLTSHDCRRHLDIIVNKHTGQYEISRNDFLLVEIPELELKVLRSFHKE